MTKAIYAVASALTVFVLCLIIYYLAGKTGNVLSFASSVLRPLVLGLVFTYLLSPVVKLFEKKLFGSMKKPSAKKIAAVVLTFVIVLLALGVILGIIAVTVTKSLSAFNPAEIKEYLVALADQFSRFWTTIEKQLASMNINLGSAGDKLGKIFNGIKSGASTLLFAVIFAIYFLLDEKIFKYWAEVLHIMASDSTRNRLLTGIGNLVPYVGPVVGFGSLIIVCLAEGSLSHLIIGGIILAAVMFIDGNIINPRMLSSNVEVHPVLVIIALLAGGKVGGVVGMLVAVPIAALLKLQFERYIERRKAKQQV